MIAQEDEEVKHLCSHNPRIVSHSEVTLRKKDASSKATSQKYVALRDAERSFILRYNENGQASLSRQVPHSDMARAIEEANKNTEDEISEKPHLTHTTQ